MKTALNLIIILLLSFSFVNASIDPSPYAITEQIDVSNTVSPATGDMSLSLPVMTIPGIDGGLNYDLFLDYSAGITIDEPVSWVGLGWNINMPSVTRIVQGVPDDYREGICAGPSCNGISDNTRIYEEGYLRTTYSHLTKKEDWVSYWKGLGFSLFSASTFGFSSITQGDAWKGEIGGSNQVFSPSDIDFDGSALVSTAISASSLPKAYASYELRTAEFDYDERILGINGFMYLDTEINEDNYILELNNPDIFYVNSPAYSGKLNYVKYAPFDGAIISSEAHICMLTANANGKPEIDPANSANQGSIESDNYCDSPLSAKFIFHNGRFDQIELVDESGTKYLFEPVVKVVESHSKQTKFPIAEELNPHNCDGLYDQNDFDYVETDLIDEYVLTWAVTRIESTRNSNDYVNFIYDTISGNEWDARRTSSPENNIVGREVCNVLPDGRLSYSEVVTYSKKLSRIETPTHYAEFLSDEQSSTMGLPVNQGDSVLYDIQLNKINLYKKENNELLKEFNFNYRTSDKLRIDDLTLESTQVCELNSECHPETKFDYEFNPYAAPSMFYDWDNWKYYYDNNRYPDQGFNADYGHNFEKLPTYRDSSAWSLSKINWPNGGSTEWLYEQDSFKFIGQKELSTTLYGGGIRVNKTICSDGLGNSYITTYEYGDGVINNLPGTFAGLTNDDTSSKIGDSSVIYSEVNIYPGSFNGYTKKIFTTAKEYPDKGIYNSPNSFVQSGTPNHYEFGVSVISSAEPYLELPTQNEFLLIAPPNDLITFYLGKLIYPFTGMDCVKKVSMPTLEDSECDLNDENLVCKTVILDKCTKETTFIWQSKNRGNGDNLCGAMPCPFAMSDIALNGNDPQALDPFMIFNYDAYNKYGTPDPYYAYDWVIWNQEHGAVVFHNTQAELACQDSDLNNVCDIQEEEFKQDFGGISFSNFRGLMLEEQIYSSNNKLVSSTKNDYGINDGNFDLNGNGYFGFEVPNELAWYHQLFMLSGDGREKAVFPPSIWISLNSVYHYLDGKFSEENYEYASNGLIKSSTITNTDLQSNDQILISEINYAGENYDDCQTSNGAYLRNSEGSDYHVWNQVISTNSLDGLTGDVLSSSMNVLDSTNKCYLSENYVWRYDSDVDEGSPDWPEEFGNPVNSFENLGGDYDRTSLVLDALGGETRYTYHSAGSDLCDGDKNGPRLTCVEDDLGNQIKYYYDNYDRLIAVEDSNSMFVNYYYDANGRLIWVSNLGAKNLLSDASLELKEASYTNAEYVSDKTHSGKYSLKTSPNNWGGSNILNDISDLEDTEYTASVWVLNDGEADAIGLYGHDFVGNLGTICESTSVPNDGYWHLVYCSFNPYDYNYEIYGDTEDLHFAGNGVYIYFDDFQFEKSTDPTQPEANYKFNFALENPDECPDGLDLSSNNNNCINWVQEKTPINENNEAILRTYFDGMARPIQTIKLMDEDEFGNNVIISNYYYNNKGLLDSVSEPYFASGNSIDKSELTNYEFSQSLLSFNYESYNSINDKSTSELGKKYFYHNDPLMRLWKVFPINEYSQYDEFKECGSEVVCTQYEYGTYYLRKIKEEINLVSNGDFVNWSNGLPDTWFVEGGLSVRESLGTVYLHGDPSSEYLYQIVDVQPSEFYSLSVTGASGGDDVWGFGAPLRVSVNNLDGSLIAELIQESTYQDFNDREILFTPDQNQVEIRLYPDTRNFWGMLENHYDNISLIEFNGDFSYSVIIDAEGNSVISKFDKLGNLVELENADGYVSTFSYDLKGNLLDSIDFKGREQSEIYQDNEYDVLGQLTKSFNLNNNHPSRFTYNDLGDIITVSDANNQVSRFEYDSLRRITKLFISLSGEDETLVKEYFYDDVNGDSCRVDSEGQSLSSEGFLCKVINYDQLTSTEYTYDSKGKIISVTENSNYSTNSDLESFTTHYEYDFAGNLIKITYPDNDFVSYEYDRLNQLISINNIDGSAEYKYTPYGLVSSIIYSNGVVQNYKYNDRNLISNIEIFEANNLLFNESYSDYDNVGNLKEITDEINSGTVSFNYDNLYNLESINDLGYYDVQSFTLESVSYEYDEMGNRLSRFVDANNQEIIDSVDSYVYGYDDRLDIANDCEFSYDSMGNLLIKECDNYYSTFNYSKEYLLEEIYTYNTSGDLLNYLKFRYGASGNRIYKFEVVLVDGFMETSLTKYSYGKELSANAVMECSGMSADLDLDEKMTLSDLRLFVQAYEGQYSFGSELFERSDYNNDQNLDLSDVEDFASSYLGYSGSVGLNDCRNDPIEVEENKQELCVEVCRDRSLYMFRPICSCKKPDVLPDMEISKEISVPLFSNEVLEKKIALVPKKIILVNKTNNTEVTEELSVSINSSLNISDDFVNSSIDLVNASINNSDYVDDFVFDSIINDGLNSSINLENLTNNTLDNSSIDDSYLINSSIIDSIELTNLTNSTINDTLISETINDSVSNSLNYTEGFVNDSIIISEPIVNISIINTSDFINDSDLMNYTEEFVLNEEANEETELITLRLLPSSSIKKYYSGNSKIMFTKDGDGNLEFIHQDHLGSNRLSTDNLGAASGTFKSLPFGQELINSAESRFTFTAKEKDYDYYYFNNRYYDPDLGRFLSIDPVKTNKPYVYVDNNPLMYVDPSGLDPINSADLTEDIASLIGSGASGAASGQSAADIVISLSISEGSDALADYLINQADSANFLGEVAFRSEIKIIALTANYFATGGELDGKQMTIAILDEAASSLLFLGPIGPAGLGAVKSAYEVASTAYGSSFHSMSGPASGPFSHFNAVTYLKQVENYRIDKFDVYQNLYLGGYSNMNYNRQYPMWLNYVGLTFARQYEERVAAGQVTSFYEDQLYREVTK